ncbi:CDP-alcohol phosphatidyltransferase family protein [Candidatus Woesearchaeota archaeon]|nr:CDP-alcohol phosphatidyltransferase family protein [Candidatus Woesearchaeota archaeon]
MVKYQEWFSELLKIPNLITLVRVILLPFLYYFAYTGNKIVFLVLFLVAGLSDTFDGIAARALNQTSKFGAKFDCFADDLINFSVLILLYWLLPEFVKQNFVIIIITISFFVVFTLLELAIHRKRLAMTEGILIILFFKNIPNDTASIFSLTDRKR